MKKLLRLSSKAIFAGLIFGVISIAIMIKKLLPALGQQNLIIQTIKSLAPLAIINLVIFSAVIITVYSSFISIGKRYNSKMLIIVSLLLMIITIAYSLYEVYATLNLVENFSGYSVYAIFFFAVRVLYLFSVSILYILLGVALVQVKEKIKLAKASGILFIVGGATIIILIGSFIIIAALVTTAVMFSRLAKDSKN